MYLYTMYIQKHCVHIFRFGVPGTLHIDDEQRSDFDIVMVSIFSSDEALELLLDYALKRLIQGDSKKQREDAKRVAEDTGEMIREDPKDLWTNKLFVDSLFKSDSDKGPVRKRAMCLLIMLLCID